MTSIDNLLKLSTELSKLGSELTEVGVFNPHPVPLTEIGPCPVGLRQPGRAIAASL